MFGRPDDPAEVKNDDFLESGTGAPPTAESSPAAASGVVPVAAAPHASAAAPQSQEEPSGEQPDSSSAATTQPAGGTKDTTRIKGNSFGNKMLNGILNALGGGKTTTVYRRDPDTGKMVATEVERSTGDKWKLMIAGALSGAAAGSAVRPGPGKVSRAGAAGFQAGDNLAEGIDEAKRQNADQDFAANQKVQVNKAQRALLTQQLATSAWEMKKSQMQFSMDMTKDMNAFNVMVGSDPTHTDLGTYSNLDDFISKNSGKETGKGLTDGVLQAFPEIDAKGNVIGVHGYRVTPGWGSKRNAEPVQIDLGGPVNGKWESKYQTIPANAYTNDEILTKLKAVGDKKATWEKEKFAQDQENQRGREKNETTIQAANIGATSRENVAKTRAAGVGQTLTSNTRTMMETAPKVIALAEKLEALIKKNQDEIGPGEGRLNELLTGKVGADNPEFVKIRTDAGLLSTLVMRMHLGARGGSQAMAYFRDLFANSAQTPGNYLAALGELRDYANIVKGTKEGENVVIGREAPKQVKFKASDGTSWTIDADKLEAAKKKDPGLKVME
jgi:hypothetical protein